MTAKSKTRLYRVSAATRAPEWLTTDRLVRAPRVSAALYHVVRSIFSVRVASQNDLVELLAQGVKPEDYEPPAHGDEDFPEPE